MEQYNKTEENILHVLYLYIKYKTSILDNNTFSIKDKDDFLNILDECKKKYNDLKILCELIDDKTYSIIFKKDVNNIELAKIFKLFIKNKNIVLLKKNNNNFFSKACGVIFTKLREKNLQLFKSILIGSRF